MTRLEGPIAIIARFYVTYRPNRTRTDDSLFVRQELYQLSYRPYFFLLCSV